MSEGLFCMSYRDKISSGKRLNWEEDRGKVQFTPLEGAHV